MKASPAHGYIMVGRGRACIYYRYGLELSADAFVFLHEVHDAGMYRPILASPYYIAFGSP